MSRSHQQGFFLIEVVIATTVIAIVLIFLLGSIQNTVDVSRRSLEKNQAAYLLEEGVEATRSIRDADWSNLANLTMGTTYYLHFGSGSWSFVTTPETVDAYTRTVVFSEVTRDTNDDIASTGTDDPGTKKGTVTVSWQTPSGIKTESVDFYITDIQ